MWILTENKCPKGQQEIKVKIMLQEMAEYTFAYDAESFERAFKDQIKEIPRTNNFSADLLFKITHRNNKSVEVWKMTIKGDFKEKLFTLNYQE